MSVLAVVGLAKEARIAKRVGLKPIIGGCDSLLLVRRLNAAAPGATAVISFGLAGALAPLLQTGDVVIATHVVSGDDHYICDPSWSQNLRAKLPQARSVVIVGVNHVVAHMGTKKALFRTTGAHAVDMESHIAARFAHERGLPFVALRAICDDALRTLPPAALEPPTQGGRVRLFAVLKSLLSDPSQFPELIQTGREAGAAFRALLRCRNLLGPELGCPYLG